LALIPAGICVAENRRIVRIKGSLDLNLLMDTPTSDTRQLIRKLSRRQWKVSLVVVALALISLFLGWWGVAKDAQIAEIINLAGRQRMLSQRMAMYLVLLEREGEAERKRELDVMAATAAGEFERANLRLAENARKLGADSAIHSLYFGPAGSVDAESRRYLSQVHAVLESSRRGGPIERKLVSDVVAAASDGLIKDLRITIDRPEAVVDQLNAAFARYPRAPGDVGAIETD